MSDSADRHGYHCGEEQGRKKGSRRKNQGLFGQGNGTIKSEIFQRECRVS